MLGTTPFMTQALFIRLYWLLRNSAHVLQSWSDRFISNIKIQLEMSKEVVLQTACHP
jgi:hypothetical protein